MRAERFQHRLIPCERAVLYPPVFQRLPRIAPGSGLIIAAIMPESGLGVRQRAVRGDRVAGFLAWREGAMWRCQSTTSSRWGFAAGPYSKPRTACASKASASRMRVRVLVACCPDSIREIAEAVVCIRSASCC